MAKIDTSGLHARLKDMIAAGREADEAGAAALAGFFVETVAELTRKDTNRAANGWIAAGQHAGVTRMAMLDYRASSRRAQFLAKMELEMEGLGDRIRRDESMMEHYKREDERMAGVPRRDGKRRKRRTRQPYYKTMEKRARRNRKSLEKLTEHYQKAIASESFIFFDADSIVQRKQKRRFSTVRDEIYGGTSAVHRELGSVHFELKNREPHVNIIERHPHLGHPIAQATALTRAAGKMIAIDRYAEVSRRRLKRAG